MTATDTATDRLSLVPGAHRLIRAIDGKEGPFAGALVTYGDSVAVCVESGNMTDWPGWAYAGSEHVCAVVDVRRRVDGHDVLLPWCTARIESFLGRRQIADAPLLAGEIGTLVASVLRGVRELGGDESTAGDWWLTADGRPMFVHGDGGAPRARSAALVERAAQHTTDRATVRVLDEVVSALRTPRHNADADRRWEEQLFAIAAPRALRLDVYAPERVSEIGSIPERVGQDVSDTLVTRRRTKPKWGWRRAAFELVAAFRRRAQVLVLRPGAIERNRGGEARRMPRRRALLLGGGLGIAVLLIGLMWPSDGSEIDAEAASDDRAVAAVPTIPPERQLRDQEALTALPALLDAVRECVEAAAATCADVVAAGATMPTDGVVLGGAEASSAAVVEDYGDVAVVKLTPADAELAGQMLVLERQNELWLLRDVYDVAQQPE